MKKSKIIKLMNKIDYTLVQEVDKTFYRFRSNKALNIYIAFNFLGKNVTTYYCHKDETNDHDKIRESYRYFKKEELKIILKILKI